MTDAGLNYFSFFLIVSFISFTRPETRQKQKQNNKDGNKNNNNIDNACTASMTTFDSGDENGYCAKDDNDHTYKQ